MCGLSAQARTATCFDEEATCSTCLEIKLFDVPGDTVRGENRRAEVADIGANGGVGKGTDGEDEGRLLGENGLDFIADVLLDAHDDHFSFDNELFQTLRMERTNAEGVDLLFNPGYLRL